MDTKRRMILLVAAVLFGLVSAVEAFSYTFDANNEGWSQTHIGYDGRTYEAWYPIVPADWMDELDGHQGVIYQTSTTDPEGRAFWMGARFDDQTAFLGDLTGKTLVADVYSTGNWRTLGSEEVVNRWVIADLVYVDSAGPHFNMWVSKAPVSVDMNSFTGWETFSIELKEENFFKWPNGAVDGTFADVLKNYDQIGLNLTSKTDDLDCYNGGSCTWGDDYTLLHYGAYAVNGTATWALDNVRPVPEPSTFLLIGGGLVLFFLGRRNRRFRRG